MDRTPLKPIDHALHDLESMLGTPPARDKRASRWSLGKVFFYLLGAVTLAIIPFVVLIRSSMHFYVETGLGAWGSLWLGAFFAALVLWLTAFGVAWRLGGRRRVLRVLARGVPALVLVYCGYALLYLSSSNAKTPVVQDTYTSLHPLLRLSVSTFVLLDGDLVVTDTARRQADYQAMGLPTNPRSLHYPQSDGYAHAVDLRTKRRAAWRNAVMTGFFKVMGLKTLRHVGTADHLHVSLPCVGQG